MLEANFLFMDESFPYSHKNTSNQKIKFGALTGILVPTRLVVALRENIYFLLQQALSSKIEPHTIDLKLFDGLLHGSNFMPDYDDNLKNYVLNGLTEIINKNKIITIRICCLVTPKNKEFYGNFKDPKFRNKILATCWAGMNDILQEFLKNNIIIPVIEDDISSEQQKLIFSGMVNVSHMLLHMGSNNCSLPENKNFSEVLYAKKNYSFLTGLVDCISYWLLQRQEYGGSEGEVNFYRKSCIEAANRILPSLIVEQISGIEFQGEKEVVSQDREYAR